MAGCGAAVEAAHWAKQHGVKVTLVDKAAIDRSGAVAMGLDNRAVDVRAQPKIVSNEKHFSVVHVCRRFCRNV